MCVWNWGGDRQKNRDLERVCVGRDFAWLSVCVCVILCNTWFCGKNYLSSARLPPPHSQLLADLIFLFRLQQAQCSALSLQSMRSNACRISFSICFWVQTNERCNVIPVCFVFVYMLYLLNYLTLRRMKDTEWKYSICLQLTTRKYIQYMLMVHAEWYLCGFCG